MIKKLRGEVNIRDVLIGLLLCSGGSAASCALFGDGGYGYVGEAVERYCTAVTAEERAVIRVRMDQATAPNQLRVVCEG